MNALYNIYGFKSPKLSWYVPCSCCGASWSEKPLASVRTYSKGIRILLNTELPNRVKGNMVVSSMKTRNGPLTIVVGK